MMLAAWNELIGSSPNGLADRDAAREAIGLEADAEIATVLSFGYPDRLPRTWRAPGRGVEQPRQPKPLEEVVRRV